MICKLKKRLDKKFCRKCKNACELGQKLLTMSWAKMTRIVFALPPTFRNARKRKTYKEEDI